MDTLEKEEMDVTGFGNPSLDADKIDDDTDAALDAALDDAISQTEPEPQEDSAETGEVVEETPTIEEEGASESVTETEQATPTPIEPQVEIDPEISAIEQPRNLSEKNQSNWRKLQETASTYKKQAQEAEALRQKLVEYESKPPLPEDYQDLRQFRALFDIASDPEFQEKYDKPIYEAKTNIYKLLKEHGADDSVLQSIEAAGGPEKISDQWWENNVINKLPFFARKKLEKNLSDVNDLTSQKINEIKKQSLNVDEYFKQKDTATRNWFENQHNESIKYIQEKIIEQKADWAMRKEIPKNANPEKIKAINSHNEQVDQLEQFFTGALFPQTPQERADIAAAAAMSHVLTNQLRTEQELRKRMDTQLKALSEENTRLKGAGKLPRVNQATSGVTKSTSVVDRLKMSSSDAIDLGLEEAGA